MAIFLIKLRKDLPFTSLGRILGSSERTLRRWFDKTMQRLGANFVPENLGFLASTFGVVVRERSIEREFEQRDAERAPRAALSNNTEIACRLLANGDASRAILICDCTYERHQRSKNYSFQRDSYSAHKKDNLFKPFMVVSPNGFILDVFGPFSARPNDADIMKQLLSDQILS